MVEKLYLTYLFLGSIDCVVSWVSRGQLCTSGQVRWVTEDEERDGCEPGNIDGKRGSDPSHRIERGNEPQSVVAKNAK